MMMMMMMMMTTTMMMMINKEQKEKESKEKKHESMMSSRLASGKEGLNCLFPFFLSVYDGFLLFFFAFLFPNSLSARISLSSVDALSETFLMLISELWLLPPALSASSSLSSSSSFYVPGSQQGTGGAGGGGLSPSLMPAPFASSPGRGMMGMGMMQQQPMGYGVTRGTSGLYSPSVFNRELRPSATATSMNRSSLGFRSTQVCRFVERRERRDDWGCC